MDLGSNSSQEPDISPPDMHLSVFDDAGSYSYFGDLSPFDFSVSGDPAYQEPMSVGISPNSYLSLSPSSLTNLKSSSWSESNLYPIETLKPRSPSSLLLRFESNGHGRRYSEPRQSRRHSVLVHPSSPAMSDTSNKSGYHSTASYSCSQCSAILFRKADLQRHLEKHTRQHSCKVLDCTRNFRNKADLHRHVREVHEEREGLKSINVCPIQSCERHRTGFARRWNLADHYRRRHGGLLPASAGSDYPSNAGKDSSQAHDDDHHSVKSSGDSVIAHAEDADMQDERYSSPFQQAEKSERSSTVSDPNSRPMRRGQSSDRVRSKVEQELHGLRAERENIEAQISQLECILARLE